MAVSRKCPDEAEEVGVEGDLGLKPENRHLSRQFLLILSQNGGLKTDFAVICRGSRQGQRERSASSTAWCRRCENENRFRIRG